MTQFRVTYIKQIAIVC